MFQKLHVFLCKFLKESTVDTMLINFWCLINIRLISFVGVRIVKADDQETIIKLKVNRRTKNHLNSMYMGAQVIGAEIGPIFYAIKYCELNSLAVNSEYSSVSAKFLKKTRSKYVYFRSTEIEKIRDAIDEAIATGSRQFQKVKVGVYDSMDFVEESLVSGFDFDATFRSRKK